MSNEMFDLGDVMDEKFNPDADLDAGTYKTKIFSCKFVEEEERDGRVKGAHFLVGLKILSGPSQQSGAEIEGKTEFARVQVPGGSFKNPEFPATKKMTPAQNETFQKKKFRSFFNSIGWTAEMGAFDPAAAIDLEPTVRISYSEYEGQDGEMRKSKNFDWR